MVKEKLLIVDIGDIARLRYTCRNPDCQAVISFRLRKGEEVKPNCPFCAKPWVFRDERQHHDSIDYRLYLLSVLRRIIWQDPDAPVTVSLEIDVSDEEETKA